jgi:hypothetical protein
MAGMHRHLYQYEHYCYKSRDCFCILSGKKGGSHHVSEERQCGLRAGRTHAGISGASQQVEPMRRLSVFERLSVPRPVLGSSPVQDAQVMYIPWQPGRQLSAIVEASGSGVAQHMKPILHSPLSPSRDDDNLTSCLEGGNLYWSRSFLTYTTSLVSLEFLKVLDLLHRQLSNGV